MKTGDSTKHLPLDAYVRVSRVGDRDVSGESYQTEATQQAAIQRWADENGREVRLNPPERNISGSRHSRPILDEIRRRIRANESGGIVAYRLDRISRSVVLTLTLFEEAHAFGTVVVSTSEPEFDATTAHGELMLTMTAALARYYLRNQADAWGASVRNAVERGVWTGRGVPLGYVKGPDKRLSIDPATAPTIRTLFERAARGEPAGSLARWLDAELPRPGGTWTGNAVRRLLARRVYLGEVVVDGATITQTNPAAHEPLVTPATWQRAQGTRRGWARLHDDEAPLLGGLVRCAGCRYGMSRSVNRSEGRERAYYRCRGKHESGSCPAPASIRADGEHGLDAYIDAIVTESLREQTGTPTLSDSTQALGAAEAALERAQARYESVLTDPAFQDELGPAGYAALLGQRERERDAAAAEVERLAVQAEGAAAMPTADEYASLTPGQRNTFIAAVIDAVVIRKVGPKGNKSRPVEDDDRVRVVFKGEDYEWPAAGRRASGVQSFPWD